VQGASRWLVAYIAPRMGMERRGKLLCSRLSNSATHILFVLCLAASREHDLDLPRCLTPELCSSHRLLFLLVQRSFRGISSLTTSATISRPNANVITFLLSGAGGGGWPRREGRDCSARTHTARLSLLKLVTGLGKTMQLSAVAVPPLASRPTHSLTS
jgi:hypothetical protein